VCSAAEDVEGSKTSQIVFVQRERTRSSHFEILRPSFAAESLHDARAANLAAASAAQDDTSRFARIVDGFTGAG
jgi:hypothetical protein